MRRLAILASLTLLLAACVDRPDFSDITDMKINTVANKPYNSVFVVVPMALATPPLNNIIFGPCENEFGMPDSRRANCELYYKARRQTSPWQQTAARAQAMSYGPGELQCWRTIGSAECTALAGPARAVNMIAPNMGGN